MRPLVLGPNQPRRFYRGGASIGAFRGTHVEDEYRPEDWLGSTTALHGEQEVGLSRLDDGRLLREVIEERAEAFFGPEHLAAFGGPDPALLVKLLDAGERLPVHAHPDRSFSRMHLDCAYGKTEAWLVLEAEPGASVHLGFRREVGAEELRRWVDTQDAAAMLEAMHAMPVQPGDSVLVPAGLPHAIGQGVFLLELQEPTDFSVLMEYAGFDLDGERDGHLGIGFDAALGCVRREPLRRDDVERLVVRATAQRGRSEVLPAEATDFFRAERLRPDPSLSLDPGYGFLVVVDGMGRLATASGDTIELRRGMTLLVPHAAGTLTLDGELHVLRCRPPRMPPTESRQRA